MMPQWNVTLSLPLLSSKASVMGRIHMLFGCFPRGLFHLITIASKSHGHWRWPIWPHPRNPSSPVIHRCFVPSRRDWHLTTTGHNFTRQAHMLSHLLLSASSRDALRTGWTTLQNSKRRIMRHSIVMLSTVRHSKWQGVGTRCTEHTPPNRNSSRNIRVRLTNGQRIFIAMWQMLLSWVSMWWLNSLR